MMNTLVFIILIIGNFALAQTTSFRYEGRLQGPTIPANTLAGQTFTVSLRRPDNCGTNLGLTAWTSPAITLNNGAFSISPTFTASALASAMNPNNNFGASCAVDARRQLVITWSGGETFTVDLEDSPRATLAVQAINAEKIGQTAVSANLACAANQLLKFNIGTLQIECQSLVATDIPLLNASQVPALGGDVTGSITGTTVNAIRGKNVMATIPLLNQVLKFDGTNWVPSADATGGAPADATYLAKGILQIDTSLASSGLSLTTGVLSLPNVVVAGGPIGSASITPVITYDAKGRLTAVTTATIDDSTKLPLAGGTMSGPINMGAFNITNATSVAATNFSGRNFIVNDNDINTISLISPADITANYSLTLPTTSGTVGQVLSTNGTGILSWVAGGGITSLGGLTAGSQTFATGAAGTAPAFSSATTIHTLNIPLASGVGVTSGTVSKTEYDSFVAKLTSPLTTKGDLFTRDATTHIRLPAGTDGQVLGANSVSASGLQWVTPANGDITDVVAGAGLTGGAATGSATVDVAAGTGIVVAADSVSVDVGTTVGKIVQVAVGGKLPILDASDLINLDAGDITAGTLPIIRGGTGLATSGTANQVLGVNAGATGLEYKTITAGTGVTITNASNAVTINATSSGGTVTSVGVSVPAYMTSASGPITTTGTIALGFNSQAAKSVFAAPQASTGVPSFRNLNIADVQSSVAGSFLTGPGCAAGQALTYISASDTLACSTIIPIITNTATLASTKIWVGDGANKAQEVFVSGDATLTSTGALTLASTVTASAAGSASAVPTINYDAKGRITSTSSAAYQDATAGVKGVVSVGTNLTVTAGAISLTGANALAAIGYTPLNKAGDTMTGNLGLNAVATDPAGLVFADKGKVWYNTTSNQVKYWDGAAAFALGLSGAGLTTLGGQNGSTQTFAVNASGTAPALTSSTNTHTLSIPLASGASVTSGTITNAEYNKFNNGTTISGTSGGIPYFNTASSKASSGLLTANGVMLGGGAGAAPTTTDAGTANAVLRIPAGGGAPAFGTIDLGTSVAGVLAIANGGTGQATGNAALNALLPGQATHSTKFLSTDGTNSSWVAGVTAQRYNDEMAELNPAGNPCGPFQTAHWASNATPSQKWICRDIDFTSVTGFIRDGGNTIIVASVPQPITIGNNVNQSLNLEANGTTHVTVLPNGNVGVGTTTPTVKLEVNGGLKVGAGNGIMNAMFKLSNQAWTVGSTVGAGGTLEQNFSISGVAVGDTVICNPRGNTSSFVNHYCYVAAVNSVKLNIRNPTGIGVSGLELVAWDITVIRITP